MRLILHPRVRSDIEAVMNYYQEVASPELADEFYSELRYFIVQQSKNRKRFQFESETFGASICGGSHIISFFASSEIRFGF